MKPSPSALFVIAAFTVLVAAPLVGVIVHEIRMDAARERARIESQARLRLLAEQQRLREAAAQFRERTQRANPNQGARRGGTMPTIVMENDRFRMWKGKRGWSIDPIGTNRLLLYKTKKEALAAWERLNSPTQEQKDAALQNFRCAVAAMERRMNR